MAILAPWISLFLAPAVLGGPTGDRLVVAEETSDLTLPASDHFHKGSQFLVVGDMMLVPAEVEPIIGLWRLGDFRPHLLGKVKTRCDWLHQENYYLPGNNRDEFGPNLSVAECQQICCDDSDCLSFDYDKDAGSCWLSQHVEGPSGLAWDTTGLYDYYELDLGEEVSSLASVSEGSETLVVAVAKHSGNLYSFEFTDSGGGMPQVVAQGAYAPAGLQLPGHSSPILTIKVAQWPEGQRLVTGGYDRTVIVWAMSNGGLVVESRIEGFEWPVWALQPSSSMAGGIFVAGGQANISRMAWTGSAGDLVGSGAPSSEQLWTEEQVLRGHSRLVRCLAYDSGLELLASGSEDTRIVLWRRMATGHNFEFGSRLFDHTQSVTSLSFILPSGPGAEKLLLSGGDDGGVMMFSPNAVSTNCAFEAIRNYYLPGNNRYEFQHSSLAECMQICCESAWCASFDFATAADPGGLHSANSCWMSTLVEGASGLQWDGSGIYHYYEIKKRGTRALALQQPGIVQGLAYAPQAELVVIERSGDAVNDGGFLLVKLLEVVCQDGYNPNYEGTECVQCRLGWAGTGGACDECPPGSYSPMEGSFACEPCAAGFASSITDEPSSDLLESLTGLVKCTECPPWSLSTQEGRNFCEWCAPGTMPNEARDACVGVEAGSARSPSNFGESWGRDHDETSDRFCPRSDPHANCMYSPEYVEQAICPMTCPRPFQVTVDDNNNFPPLQYCTKDGCYDYFPPRRKICKMQSEGLQQQCNKILCMGALVRMEGDTMRQQCVSEGFNTDCTCAESIRESCKVGLKRLRMAQCSEQCSQDWCREICNEAAAREYRGIFRSDNNENAFWVRECQPRGTSCEATCQNDQRRISVIRECGRPDIYDSDEMEYRIWNDALCGGSTSIEEVCSQGRMEGWDLYRPDACGALRGSGQLALGIAFWRLLF